MQQYNYAKLTGRMRERGYTQESLAKAIRLFVKRNFSRDGKNQAEKPCRRLKAVFGGG